MKFFPTILATLAATSSVTASPFPELENDVAPIDPTDLALNETLFGEDGYEVDPYDKDDEEDYPFDEDDDYDDEQDNEEDNAKGTLTPRGLTIRRWHLTLTGTNGQRRKMHGANSVKCQNLSQNWARSLGKVRWALWDRPSPRLGSNFGFAVYKYANCRKKIMQHHGSNNYRLSPVERVYSYKVTRSFWT